MRNPFRRSERQVTIVPNQVFLHGPDRFEKGKAYKVGVGLARYFERNGWIEGSDPVPPPTVSVDIDNGVIGQSGGF